MVMLLLYVINDGIDESAYQTGKWKFHNLYITDLDVAFFIWLIQKIMQ